MTNAKPLAPWITPIARMIADEGGTGAYFVVMPGYRPELVTALAEALGMAVRDVRAEHMRPLGWEAGRMPLAALTDSIRQRCGPEGLVVQNAEALLATKEVGERQNWLEAVVMEAWPGPVIVPIAIFQADLPKIAGRAHRIEPEDLPQESLLVRLARQ